jgi:hypothetical protein
MTRNGSAISSNGNLPVLVLTYKLGVGAVYELPKNVQRVGEAG